MCVSVLFSSEYLCVCALSVKLRTSNQFQYSWLFKSYSGPSSQSHPTHGTQAWVVGGVEMNINMVLEKTDREKEGQKLLELQSENMETGLKIEKQENNLVCGCKRGK